MRYVFKNLHAMALFLRELAVRSGTLAESPGLSNRTRTTYEGERNAYLYAAEVCKDAVVEDVALYDEYRVAYTEAQAQLANAMWSILKVAGVPTAVYALDQGWARR